MQRHQGAFWFFSSERFVNASDPKEITDEIALNPLHFATRKPDEVLSTLVHEMVHLWQHHFGERPRKGYHDGQWAAKMREVGLIPTATGEMGGRETGQKVTHLVEENGRYAQASQSSLKSTRQSSTMTAAARTMWSAKRKLPAKRNIRAAAVV
jgi:hypothetical protein